MPGIVRLHLRYAPDQAVQYWLEGEQIKGNTVLLQVSGVSIKTDLRAECGDTMHGFWGGGGAVIDLGRGWLLRRPVPPLAMLFFR